MKGFVLQTPGKKRATPSRSRGAPPSTEYECPPTPRHTRDAAVEREFAQRGVRTVLAIKPLEAEGGLTKAEYPILTFDTSSRALVTTAPPMATPGDSTPEHSFDSRYFDHVYQGPTLRVDLKRELQPIVDSVVGGRSAAIVAYGQTGSGKTFLMEGAPSSADRAAWGLAPHAIYKVLQAVQKSSDKKFLVSVSCLEVYNEVVKDLLVPQTKGAPGSSLRLKLNTDGYYDVPEATSTPVSSVNQALALLRAAAARRAQGATAMNARSSRSFADVILTVESIDAAGRGACCARLHLVDLAGSERQAQTGAEGGRLKESSSINLALLALRKVVQARSAAASTRPPYTDSKVTKILKDALSGDAALLVVCCLSASPVNYQDSLSTLKFAASCRSLTAKPIVRRVSVAHSRIGGLSVAVERIRAAEQAVAAERLIRLESRAVAQEIELQVAEARLSEARGQIQAGANLAAAAHAACEELLAHCAAAVDELVAGQGAEAEAAAGLLARHVLPQLDFCLDNPQMIAHVAPSALLRFVKALLQVNFAAAHSAAAPLAHLFTRLLQPEVTSPSGSATVACSARLASGCESLLTRTWPGLLTYCAKLVLAETVGAAEPLPPFVLTNLESAVRAIAREVKTVSELGAAGPEAQEAVEVSGRVVSALEGRESFTLRARFLGPFRAIVGDVASRQKERLFDLGSPVGSSKPSSPGSWLTPSRSRVKADSPRGKEQPGWKSVLAGAETDRSEEQPGGESALAGAETNRLNVRGLEAFADGECFDTAHMVGEKEPRTSRTYPKAKSLNGKTEPRVSQLGDLADGAESVRSVNVSRAVSESWGRPKNPEPLRSVAGTGQAQAPSNSTSQQSASRTGQVEGPVRPSLKVRTAEEVARGGAEPERIADTVVCTGEVEVRTVQGRDCTAEIGGELLLGEEAEGSPGSWLTPGYQKTKVSARVSKLGEGRADVWPGQRGVVGAGVVGRHVAFPETRDGEFRPSDRAKLEPVCLEKMETASVEVSETRAGEIEANVRKRDDVQGAKPVPAGKVSPQGGTTGGKNYPRLLISGEWRTPEYMKGKETVSRKVKTCARAAAGPRTPAARAAAWTPEDTAAAATMASVKKVLFLEDEEGTRGSIGAARTAGVGFGEKARGFDGSEVSDSLVVFEGAKSSALQVHLTELCVPSSEKRIPLGGPVSKNMLSRAGGLGGGLEPRQVLSPLKEPGARPLAAWKTSPFGAQYYGKENARTDPQSLPKTTLVTSPFVLPQSLLKSPRTSVRPFRPIPTSAVRPPRAALGRSDPSRPGGTPARTTIPGEQNGNGNGTGNGNKDAFAHLRGQLQSLLLSGENRETGSGATGNAACAAREHDRLKVTGRTETGLQTPDVTRTGGATSFLSPALLWTPSQGPSPSLDSLRERLAGMVRH